MTPAKETMEMMSQPNILFSRRPPWTWDHYHQQALMQLSINICHLDIIAFLISILPV